MDPNAPFQPNQAGVVNPAQQPAAAQPYPQPAATPQVQGGSVPPPQKQNKNSTQNSLDIAEIRDGIVIMKDGSYRSVIIAPSINFDLMSPQEREAVEGSYQGFLNSLYFPIQIQIRSTKVDLRTYMKKLEKVRANQDNILLSLLMEDYIAYIEYLAETANIMDKRFYVVVPYNPSLGDAIQKRANSVKSIFGTKKNEVITINEQEFTKAKTALTQQTQAVIEAMNQMGIQGIPLNTQELIEMYYDAYNPDTATAQPLINYQRLEGEVVTKGQGDAPRLKDN